MRSEEEIREYKYKIVQKLALIIAHACVGYRENIKATINDLRGQLKALDYVLQRITNERNRKDV